ncbi:MAG: late competence protein ComER [Bacillaceae bacterium]
MKIGIIGTGNMGKILIDAFIEGKTISPSQLYITNRTIQKAYAFQEQYPTVHVIKKASQLIRTCDLIFLCIKPHDMTPLLKQHATAFSEDKCLISITSPINVHQLYSLIPCHIARAIPSITNRALSGVTLLTFHEKCGEEWRKILSHLLGSISKPIIIENDVTRISSDIVSCGPAFFSFLLQKYIDAAVHETNITKEQATQLATEMFIGMGKLLEKGIFTLPTLQEKVCVKGGITGEGIAVLESEMDGVFERVIQRTHRKYNDEVNKVIAQIYTD